MFAYGATAKLRCLSGDRKLAFETGGNIVRPMPRYPCAIWSISGYKPLDRWLYVKAASHGPTAYQVPCQFGLGLFPGKADVQSPDLVEIRCFEKGGFQSMEEQVWNRKAGRLCWSCISGNTCCMIYFKHGNWTRKSTHFFLQVFCHITINYKESATLKRSGSFGWPHDFLGGFFECIVASFFLILEAVFTHRYLGSIFLPTYLQFKYINRRY